MIIYGFTRRQFGGNPTGQQSTSRSSEPSYLPSANSRSSSVRDTLSVSYQSSNIYDEKLKILV